MWKLKFISKENFYKHIQDTIEKYGEKLESYDLKKFNKNIIDPIKLIFDRVTIGLPQIGSDHPIAQNSC